MEEIETECCTPNGQIKRYKDCIGCDKKPLELNQNKMTPKEEEYNRFKKVCVIKNNAKQKAEELVWMFGKNINKLEMTYSQAKQCALIAVDELINYSEEWDDSEYWQEVKEEIINL